MHSCINCFISKSLNQILYIQNSGPGPDRICCGQVQHFHGTSIKHFIVVDLHNTKCCMRVIQNVLCYTEKSPTDTCYLCPLTLIQISNFKDKVVWNHFFHKIFKLVESLDRPLCLWYYPIIHRENPMNTFIIYPF